VYVPNLSARCHESKDISCDKHSNASSSDKRRRTLPIVYFPGVGNLPPNFSGRAKQPCSKTSLCHITKKKQAHSLNFFGRVKLPSKKNFLLVASIKVVVS